MNYSWYEIASFILIYSFLGWCGEVIFFSLKSGYFRDRGFLDLPLCFSCGMAVTILSIGIPTLRPYRYMQVIAYLAVTLFFYQCAVETTRLAFGSPSLRFRASLYNKNVFRSMSLVCLLAVVAFVVVSLIHPFVFVFVKILPPIVLKYATTILMILSLADLFMTIYFIRNRNITNGLEYLADEMQEQKYTLGARLSNYVWKRARKVYPDLIDFEKEQAYKAFGMPKKQPVFAEGVCFHKLIWVFFITAFLGDIIETLFVHAKIGVWMSRSSVLFGSFSVVWGIGAMLLTLILYPLIEKTDRYIFAGGFVLGGTYEYMASLVLEVFLGAKFWDYSDMLFNLNGRTNLLYCIFWGLLSVVWLKLLYPKISIVIERIPAIAGVTLTWIMVTLMVADLAISGIAIARYMDRMEHPKPESIFEEFLDLHYPNELIEHVWPNLIVLSDTQ